MIFGGDSASIYPSGAGGEFIFFSAATGGAQVTTLTRVSDGRPLTHHRSRADGSFSPFNETTNTFLALWADPGNGQQRIKIPCNADLAFVGLPTTAPTDGQLLAYSAATGLYAPVNPSGSSELAYAENMTGTQQTGIVTGPTDITACSIAVPASTRPVYLSCSASAIVVSGGGATAYAGTELVEVSNGVDTPIATRLTIMQAAVSAAATLTLPPFRIGPTLRTRTFKLVAYTITANITIRNGAAGYGSWILAEAK